MVSKRADRCKHKQARSAESGIGCAGGNKIVVTVTAKQAEADGTYKTGTAEFSVVENQTPALTEQQIKLNQPTEGKPLGFTYRAKNAVSVVQDAERGEVVRVDSKVGVQGEND